MALTALGAGGIAALSIVIIALLKRFFNGGRNIHTTTDLSGKVIVITGANTGLGYIAALEMAKLKPQVIIFACRSEQRGTDAIK